MRSASSRRSAWSAPTNTRAYRTWFPAACPFRYSMMLGSESDFAVVGAGLAGLRTALRLTAAGARVTVFEARERVGGPGVSAPRPPAETAPLGLDLGAQWGGPA